MAEDNRVAAVERALSILDAFEEEAQALSLARLSERTGLYKSTILRLSGSLERFGYLSRSGDGLYRLGPNLWRLGALARRAYDLGEYVRPVLRSLADATGETVAFYVRAGDKRLCLYRLNSARAVRHHLDEGALLPIDRGASGRVLLAFGGADGAVHEATRARGHYQSRGERDPDVAAVAVPVFDRTDTLRGALSISALITRLGPAEADIALDALLQGAAQLRSALPA